MWSSFIPEEGLRLSIHLDLTDPDVAWLGQLPWELVRDENRYLLRNPKYSLARCLDLSGPAAPTRVKQPLKVLIVFACPKGVRQFEVEPEYRELEKSFRNSPSVKVELLEEATPECLGQRVRKEAFHIVHFVGHASFDSGSGRGCFLLNAASGAPHPVEAEDLADLLHGKATPQLLVLNACQTASFSWRAEHDPWGGLATALLMAEFPAVVAMQFPITDKAAVAFSRGFYGLLAAGYPVDLAVTGGRQAIFVANPSGLEWATPVLYLRGMEGNIFRVKAQHSSRGTVVIEARGEPQEIQPRYEERLVEHLAEFLELAPADLKLVGPEKSEGHYTIELPVNAVRRLWKAVKSAEPGLERRRQELAFSVTDWSVGEGPHTWSSAAITFGVGILGNLLAAWLQKELLRDSFTLPRVISLLVLSAIFVYWGLFARVRSRLGSRRWIATLVAGAVLLMCFALLALLIGPRGDCDQVSRVELDMPTAHTTSLNLASYRITEIHAQDLQNINRLSGRAVLFETRAGCLCEWSGRTDQDSKLSDLGSSTNCSFTIDLPAQYNWIYLRLKIGDKLHLFTVHANDLPLEETR
jgi:hypothetical protein